jgi:hypothetical protein
MSRWRESPDPQQIAMRPGRGTGNRGISAAASGADFILESDPVARATG